MKTTLTRTFLPFLLLLGGMLTFSSAQAQITCDCIPGHPYGYCYTANNGQTKCHKIKIRSGWRMTGQSVEQASLSISPNPVSNSATITFFIENTQNVSLKIFDINGRLVSTIADRSFDDIKNELVWNTESVFAGIYFLQFQSKNTLERIKLIVTK